MSTKDIVLELYHDMKAVRPAVEALVAAGIVQRIELLEQRDRDEDTARRTKGQIIVWSNKALAVFMAVCTFIISLTVALFNIAT